MRSLLSTLLLLIAASAFSQSFRYYRPGQNFSSAENACLLIKNDAATLKNLALLPRYTSFKAIKLSGFEETVEDLDSLLAQVARVMQPELLILENCDLSGLNVSLSSFRQLKEIELLNCILDENRLFWMMKGSAVQTLSIQQRDPDLMLDSMYLAPRLEKLQVSSTRVFASPNKTERLQFGGKGEPRNVEVAYFGSFYKEERPAAPAKRDPAATGKKAGPVSFSCIRQPIPGIDINDTLYYFSASDGHTVDYESGSRIQVDPAAFVTLSGETYEGKVQLFYREFRNPVEIMLSGIPMTNQVNGKTELFKSGGMYEINAADSKGNQLKTRSDTSIKINFALTDTSESFRFFSLNDNGSWTVQNPVTSGSRKDSSAQATRAVREYYALIMGREQPVPDTTNYEARFASSEYLYRYRKDNLLNGADSSKHFETYIDRKRKRKNKSLFRVKYMKQTRDKEIIFTLLPARKDADDVVPRYIQPLLNKTYVYTGALSSDAFRKTFSRKQKSWDLRLTAAGNNLDFQVKTDRGYAQLSGMPVTLKDSRSYVVQKNGGAVLGRNFKRMLQREAFLFNRKTKRNKENTRWSDENYNSMNGRYSGRREEAAFMAVKQYQNAEESAMDLETWKKYIKKRYPMYHFNSFQYSNEVGDALLKSGLGIKNIDAYIHSGQMDMIYVRYNASQDSLNEYNAMLFKSINTTYPFNTRSLNEQDYLSGYYFIDRPNYLVRFSENGSMQVTRPSALEKLKGEGSGKMTLAYKDEYNVKGMNSNDITRLILND